MRCRFVSYAFRYGEILLYCQNNYKFVGRVRIIEFGVMKTIKRSVIICACTKEIFNDVRYLCIMRIQWSAERVRLLL